MKYQLICMSFDGEYKRESFEFDSIEETWEYSNDMGSKWYFYPFHFVVRGDTIKDAPYDIRKFCGKRIKTVQKIFKKLNEKESMQGVGGEEFLDNL